ncbi:Acetyltransferase (GNAT) family protein [Bremerella volcania]|uniref:Acetyltransferase (GNAT) family protein n=1 Tax=Bremerella volcania TaxID=2527984 RepID=A0A518CDH6_9BACT|nr:GNAT family N-acetyltransferase [Bremerella volcania]QDU77279.1 Acetyltransferase (GNAT) family protein [Bremerella volcania]
MAGLNPLQIAETIESNDTEFCSHWAQSSEVELAKEKHWYRLTSGIAHPYFNSVFEANIPPEQLTEAIDEAIAPFRERSLPMAWWVGPKSQPASLGQMLVGHGFEHVACEAAMAIRPFDADYERASEEVEVQAVTSITDLRTWVEIMTGVYGLPEFTQEPWFRILKQAGLGSRKKLQHFMAIVDGEVAGVGSIFYGIQAAGIYNIAVLPEFRGQGVASTLTISLLSLIDERGVDLATLCASRKAESLYRQIGFRRYGELNCYAWMPH